MHNINQTRLEFKHPQICSKRKVNKDSSPQLKKSRNGKEHALRYVTSFGPMNLLYNLLERMTSHGGVRVLSHFEILLVELSLALLFNVFDDKLKTILRLGI